MHPILYENASNIDYTAQTQNHSLMCECTLDYRYPQNMYISPNSQYYPTNINYKCFKLH